MYYQQTPYQPMIVQYPQPQMQQVQYRPLQQNHAQHRGLTQEKKSYDQNKQTSQPQSNMVDNRNQPLIHVAQKAQNMQSHSFGKKTNHKLKDVVSQMDNPHIAENNNGVENHIHINQQNIQQRLKQNRYYIDDLINAFQDENLHDSKLFRENFASSFNAIPMIKALEFNDEQVQTKKIRLDDYPGNLKCIQKNNLDKKTIVFDLDETLVHCNEEESMKSQIVLPITFPTGETVNAGINIRPFAEKMIRLLSEMCEVMIFTASHQCYADEVLLSIQQVINHLDPENKVSKRIFRESCVTVGDSYFIKNLEVIDRDLKDVVLIDNASYSFAHHIENGIPIISFYDDKNDNQLIKLHRFLVKYILPAEDVRPIIKEYFKLDQIDQHQNIIQAVEEMYCKE